MCPPRLMIIDIHNDWAITSFAEVAKGQAQYSGKGVSVFTQHEIRVGQDCAVYFGQDGVFFGRVVGLMVPRASGKGSLLECRGSLSLETRLPGVKVRCVWFELLDSVDVPTSLQRSLAPCYHLGNSMVDVCT